MAPTEKNETATGEQQVENLKIRMKIIDMIEYALPLIERWSVPHQKLLGDKIALCMEEMLELANELEWAYSKKTPHKNLDMKNKALQDFVTLAYRLKYLKGSSSHAEWTRRSKEIGSMLGGYKKWLLLRLPICGGSWNNTSNAGVFNVNLNNPRSNSNSNIGFRSALLSYARGGMFKDLPTVREDKGVYFRSGPDMEGEKDHIPERWVWPSPGRHTNRRQLWKPQVATAKAATHRF